MPKDKKVSLIEYIQLTRGLQQKRGFEIKPKRKKDDKHD